MYRPNSGALVPSQKLARASASNGPRMHRLPTTHLSLVFLAVLSAFAPTPTAASAALAGPDGPAFYTPPSPLPRGTHGDVIWSRPLTGASYLDEASVNTLVLYHTTSVTGQDVAVSGAIALPKGTPPPGGWPVITWAHGTTGNAPQCTPTRLEEADYEQTYLEAWVKRGYAVVQTDYEGQGTPGIHPYFVGVSAARDATDIIRAARSLYPQIGKRWFVFGHSEGGSASIFTAAVGPSWAPELQLQGAVAFAPGAQIPGFLKSAPNMQESTPLFIFLLEMIQGIGSSDPAIDLRSLLTEPALARLPKLQERCTLELIGDEDFMSLAPSGIFRPGANIEPLYRDFVANDDDKVHLGVPLLLLQGDGDQVVSPEVTTTLDYQLCTNGTHVTYIELPGKTHHTIVTDTLDATAAWIDGVATGKVPPANC